MEIEPAFGTWEDVRRIGENFDILIDWDGHYISSTVTLFPGFHQEGKKVKVCRDLFITLDKIWPGWESAQSDVARIFLRKADNPFSSVTIEETGQVERIWTSFGTKDWSEQIDLDVRSEATRKLLTEYLAHFSQQQIKIVRLDAVGYVIKKPGTSCFMVEPEIYEFIDWIIGVAHSFGLELLPEVHDDLLGPIETG